MAEITLSINQTTDQQLDVVRELLKRFEQHSGQRVLLQVFDWGQAWDELSKIATYRRGPAISEAGSTWVGALAAMNALRPFSPAEIDSLGGAGAFLPEAWYSGRPEGSSQVYAVPWFCDVSVICYRRDLLEQAGVSEATAFASLERLQQTLERLQSSGVCPAPWAEAHSHSFRPLHNIAAWVWGLHGDFISRDGRSLLLSSPQARAGIKAYYSLHPYVPRLPGGLDDAAADQRFLQGQAAVILGDLGLQSDLHDGRAAPVVAANYGMAIPPGVPSMGGSDLVIWDFASPAEQQAALELVAWLSQPEVQIELAQRTHLLPARHAALDRMLADEPYFTPMIQTLRSGRAFRQAPNWGLVEDRLHRALIAVWQELCASPTPDLDRALSRHLDPLVRRLETTLSSQSH